ncbi:ribose-5-phosphate isomerase RpiA [Rhodobacterales bacterium HKCCE2091]|nr:ribose-5-phosphate isomerase RpiA [Rhodobacterales bacterium HKCCE2091]
MTEPLSPEDRAKFAAARKAVELVEDGMKVGLGTGSTAAHMVRLLGGLVRDEGLKISAVATSTQTAKLASEVGITVSDLDDLRWLDLTIDGADEVDPQLNLIKGGGGALLMEKIVATASDQMVVIADRSKSVGRLGAFPLPVEVLAFGWQTSKGLLEEMLSGLDVDGREVVLRMADDVPFRTDQGNLILDLHLSRIGAPLQLALALNQIPGVVDNGLFLDMCDLLILGHEDGTVSVENLATGRISHERVGIAEPDNLFTDISDR